MSLFRNRYGGRSRLGRWVDRLRVLILPPRCVWCRTRGATIHANGGTWWHGDCFDENITRQFEAMGLYE
jgi:hypothetical protein